VRERIFKDWYFTPGFNITFIKTHVEVVSKQRNYTKSPVMQHSYNRLYEVLSLDNSDGQ